MNTPVSRYLIRPQRTLAAVCRAQGRNDHGRACATCLLQEVCDPREEQSGAGEAVIPLSSAP